jgi:penicillin-insensitive murein endopeptidase
MRRSLAVLLALTALAVPASAKEWGEARRPVPGPAQPIGGPAAGCIAGAESLPPDGPGYQAVRLSRNRTWGHPQTVAYVKKLGSTAAAMGLPPIYVGDLSQPRGGPMATGHASHQNGLDADIWFDLDPKPDLPARAREDIRIVDLVTADESAVDPARWRPAHEELLRAAAGFAEVDRIFVHFAIKKHLCGTVSGDRGWLRKVRPWRGHREHFHVRLSCPAGSTECTPQPAIAPGDGCDATLDWWFADAAERRKAPPPAPQAGPPRPKMPARCAAILRAP